VPRFQPLTEVGLRHAAITPQAEALACTPVGLEASGCVASGHGACAKTRWRTTATTATLPAAVREIEEVVPVNAVSTWVLPSGITVGR
jgi:hypothetical protein